MPSFSSSEISSMISSKKYRIKRGDTLSGLADKFQGSFPSAKCMNKSSLMDKIYNMNRSAFGKDKNIILEGKDLDLKFVADCRCHLKIDKSKKEYVFTDEDRLVFAIKGANAFWDDFIKVDRNIGESMKTTFRNMPGSSLPKSMPLPITKSSSSSGSGRKIMEAIGRTLSGAMVTTDQIVETFLKMSGASYSNGQVKELAVRLEKENGTCRCSANCPCSAPRDKIEQLSCKCLEECYCCMPIKQDKYIITKFDVGMGLDKLLKRIKNRVKIFLNGKEIKGNEKIKEGDCLIPIDKIEGTVYKFQGNKNWSNVNSRFKQDVIKAMCELYCHYKKEGKTWRILEITSAYRTAPDQARVMVEESHLRRKNLVNEYIYKESMRLLEHLYEYGDLLTHDPIRFHQDPNLILIHEYQKNPNNYNPSQLAKDQWALYTKITHSGEKAAFERYFSFSAYERIYNNKQAMIEFLILWLQETGYVLPHMRKTALDFSSSNKGEQQEKFRRILENSSIKMNEKNYSSGNFHISQ